jgi:hypothetical protein
MAPSLPQCRNGVRFQSTFGRSGHTTSQRSWSPAASRFGQSPFRSETHADMLPLRPCFAISLATS